VSNFDVEDPFEEGDIVMPEPDGLMRIFWPLDIPRTVSPGVIVGWRNSELDFLVVAILEDVEVGSKLGIRSISYLLLQRHGTWRVH
jgi:hypothetical protein